MGFECRFSTSVNFRANATLYPLAKEDDLQ